MLPEKYSWLSKEGAPKMLLAALAEYGTKEYPGSGNNTKIVGWAKEVGGSVARDYTNDSIPWCGLFMALIAKRSEKDLPANPLWALNWVHFGVSVPVPMLGDVLVFKRQTSTGVAGHVTLYVGEDAEAYHCIGGNQGDSVSIVRISKSRLFAARRPIYKIGQPANVRRVFLSPSGNISNNEQ